MLKVKRFVFMVLIVSFISVSATAALALTAREEKLIDICKRYEDWFASHARSYGKTLPMGAGHLEFTCYRVPQTYTYEDVRNATGESAGMRESKLIAEIKSSGWHGGNNKLHMRLHTEDSECYSLYNSDNSLHAAGLSFTAHNALDEYTRGLFNYKSDINNNPPLDSDSLHFHFILSLYTSPKDVRAEVSESSPNAGTMRQITGSLWNFGSWVTDVDDGAFVVIKYSGGVKNGEAATFFKTDCTECANIMARFLNDIFPVMASE